MPSREELAVKYQNESSNRIAEDYGVTGRTVRNWLNRYEISMRKKGPVPRKLPSREELSQKCEIMSLRQVARDYGTDHKVVKKWVIYYDISIEPKNSSRKIFFQNKKTSNIQRPSAEELISEYRIRSSPQIAEKYGVSVNTVDRWRKFYNIRMENLSKGIKIISKKHMKKIGDDEKKPLKISTGENNKVNVYDFVRYVKPLIENYKPGFFLNPEETLSRLEKIAAESSGDEKRWDSIVFLHYKKIFEKFPTTK